MQVGTVIQWSNFPYPQYGGPKKSRFFVCLGSTNRLNPPVLIYFHSTTTKKRNKNHFFFPCDRYPFFRKDCYLCYNERPYTYGENELKQLIKKHDISTEGQIMNNDLRKIYEGIRNSNTYSKREILDIRSSLNFFGIIGLKSP
jgi:hypothetical protein